MVGLVASKEQTNMLPWQEAVLQASVKLRALRDPRALYQSADQNGGFP
jgi:hypothetical protein